MTIFYSFILFYLFNLFLFPPTKPASCSFSIPAPFYKMTSPLTRPVSLVSMFSNFPSLSYYFLLCCPHSFRTILPSFSSDPKSCQRSFIIIRISSSAPTSFHSPALFFILPLFNSLCLSHTNSLPSFPSTFSLPSLTPFHVADYF